MFLYGLVLLFQKNIKASSSNTNFQHPCLSSRINFLNTINAKPISKNDCNFNTCKIKCRNQQAKLKFTDGSISEIDEIFKISCFQHAEDTTEATWLFDDYHTRRGKPEKCSISENPSILDKDLVQFLKYSTEDDTKNPKFFLNDEQFKIEKKIPIEENAVNFFEPNFPFPFTLDNEAKGTEKTWPKELQKYCGNTRQRSNFMMNMCLDAIMGFCPEIAEVDIFGWSTYGQGMRVLKFSEDSSIAVDTDTPTRKTQIGLIANMHGNEASGRELLLWFSAHVCVKYMDQEEEDGSEKNEFHFIKLLLKNSDIFILPTVNPDGYKERYDLSSRDEYHSKPASERKESDLDTYYDTWVTGRYINFKNDSLKVDMNRAGLTSY